MRSTTFQQPEPERPAPRQPQQVEKFSRMSIDRAPQAVIKRMLVREVRQFGGLFESRIPIIAQDIAKTLELSQPKREEHE